MSTPTNTRRDPWRWLRFSKRTERLLMLVQVFAMLTCVAILVSIALGKLADFERRIERLPRLPEWVLPLAGALLVAAVGYALALLKRRRQLWYGWTEFAFAYASAYSVIVRLQRNGETDRLTLGLSLIGACYLAVRGLSNIFEARARVSRRANANSLG